jgi:hypothetical protein
VSKQLALPEETKTSCSVSEKLLLISKDFFINSFVTPLIADETTIIYNFSFYNQQLFRQLF